MDLQQVVIAISLLLTVALARMLPLGRLPSKSPLYLPASLLPAIILALPVLFEGFYLTILESSALLVPSSAAALSLLISVLLLRLWIAGRKKGARPTSTLILACLASIPFVILALGYIVLAVGPPITGGARSSFI